VVVGHQLHRLPGFQHLVAEFAAARQPHAAAQNLEFTAPPSEAERPLGLLPQQTTIGLNLLQLKLRVHHQSPVRGDGIIGQNRV